ncbi:response regulator transcription factor [Tetragenococcus koreensis]|uniref:LuxR family transcriptional regulator n=1 Tax=Tetragenococcus koreensis TaxID=290335 RepID=A0AAN4RLR8_9ENTE|nr:LuxR C-terminal-related transcriptional regulator [Tetragenococcus koreensis]GEQ49174.1 LuxR family transcriptional regulator [Tetragenococcus koreensis]GEQ51730.1 LuxR family transcriptional regulator [Tetragenococcus koreensis]GEQ54315.1 LuxR family transcriptional regulator [Tetragenococcus koreensis]GEQ56732.1 LuxR family transcriptional regulator [Tetragenococcus koreensis]GEQ59187.1 LuxR family transcriptional regulator [Tetragenococcus koreensis]
MIIVFIYNILLIVLYTIALSLTMNAYLKEKKKFFLALSCYLLFYILDNIIIYMTEFLNNFALQYNEAFMNVPAAKTFIFMGNAIFFLLSVVLLADQKFHSLDYITLVLLLMWMLFIPLMANSALKVWLYYLPNQLFSFYVGMRALNLAKKFQHKTSEVTYLYLKRIGILAIIFSIAIILEDSYVIFNVDQYSSLTLKIYNRNVCEDIFSIIISSFVIYFFIHNYQLSSSFNEQAKTKEQKEAAHFQAFCQNYQFTQREQDIFKLLLQNKQNQEIADELYLSLGTVKAHVHNIFVKLSIKKRTQIRTLYEQEIEEANHFSY